MNFDLDTPWTSNPVICFEKCHEKFQNKKLKRLPSATIFIINLCPLAPAIVKQILFRPNVIISSLNLTKCPQRQSVNS